MQHTYLHKNNFFTFKFPTLRILTAETTDTTLEDLLKDLKPEGLASLRTKEFIL